MLRNFPVLLFLLALSEPGHTQIVINEIIPPNTVEIANIGASSVNIASYTLSQFPGNSELSAATLLCGGDLLIEAGTLIAVNVSFAFNGADGELAFYLTNGNFDNPSNIIDYVEWGAHGHTRSSVAEAAGIWTDGDFVPSWTGCASLEYDGNGDASTDWMPQDIPTSPCVPNALDGCGGSNCVFAGAGLSGLSCANNNTPSDPADDYVQFNLNPNGVDLGSQYLVSVSSGTIDPTSAPYGAPSLFRLQDGSAGAGDVTVTITDEDDPDCTFEVLITDPGTCSSQCLITDPGLSGIFCNDADSPADSSDDFIMFNLDPSGVNLGDTYEVSVSSGTVMPTSANYGILTTFDLNEGSAGGGPVTVTLYDSQDSACTAEVVVFDPGTCSTACEITSGGLSNVICNNNGTPEDDGDDFTTFLLDPEGFNTGDTFAVFVSSGSIDPISGIYGTEQLFTLNPGSAGGGNVTVTIFDFNHPMCSLDVVIPDPGACSTSCNLSSAGLSSLLCNNNGSGGNPADDYVTFLLNPVGVNVSTSYSVSVSAGGITPSSAQYGAPTMFALNNGSAGAGNVSVTISDDAEPACDLTVQIEDPGTCSGDCLLSNGGLGNVECHDNGTAADPADDVIQLTLDPTGVNLSPQYTVSASIGTISPDTANYGAPSVFTLNPGSAGAGNVTITIQDTGDSACTIEIIVTDPGTCSDACSLNHPGLEMLTCNDNGTMDESDDYLTFGLNPTGNGLSGQYTLSVDIGSITPDTAGYGSVVVFALNPGSAGGGNVQLTISDTADASCQLMVLIADPGSCSAQCEITSAGLADIQCNNSGTPEETDDALEFTLSPVGVGLGDGYHVDVSAGTITPDTGAYGNVTAFFLNPGSAGGGNVSVTLTDVNDPLCMLEISITDPGPCSEAPCDVTIPSITTPSETTICVDDGIIDSIFIQYVGPPGIAEHQAWLLEDTQHVIIAVYPLSSDTTFTFEGGDAGVCLIRQIAYDGMVTGLQAGENSDTLTGCFALSNAIVVTKLTGSACETGIFNPDLAAMIRLYPVPVSGSLMIESGDVAVSSVGVIDLLGRTVRELSGERLTQIDLSGLDTGMYYILLETNVGWALQRITVGR